MIHAAVAAFALLLAAPVIAAPLDDIAARYVRLSLEADTHDPGYVDAYYGPPDWQAAAKANPRPLPALRAEAKALQAALAAIPEQGLEPDQRRRRIFLSGQLRAAATRLALKAGEKLPFADEAEGLFSVRPVLKPLAAYDPVLTRIATLVPGAGPLWQRVDALQERTVVPRDRLEPVMRAAIAECRARTARHIALPPAERFDLEFVTGKPWSGYNWYKGGGHSLIQVNTDLAVRIGRAIDLGCHEGYPGHHALNLLLEQRLAKGRGWIEFTVYPLYSPQSFLAEGTANYGIDLAFPNGEVARFERERLFPLAGLDPAFATRLAALRAALNELAGARLTIAQMYLDGQVDRARAVELAQTYQLLSRPRAEQSIAFADTYRSYVINYGVGEALAKAHVERQPDRWRAFERLISEPTVPADLAR